MIYLRREKKNKSISIIISSILLLCNFVLPFQPSTALAAFKNSNFISDYTFRNSSSMSAENINDFLLKQGSWLANYKVPQNIDVPYPTTSGLKSTSAEQKNEITGEKFYGKIVAQLIYDEAKDHHINPQLILVILQRESSAITNGKASSDTAKAWAMFYMYDDRMKNCLTSKTSCNDERLNESDYKQRAKDFGGIGKQIAYAAAWFNERYNDFSGAGYFGQTYDDAIKIDGQTVTCKSAATRVLYLYTPHTDPAQVNLYNFFTNWFGDPLNTTVSEEDTSLNDTAPFEVKTYQTKIKLSGTKMKSGKAYFNNQLIADSNTQNWNLEINPVAGLSNQFIIYKNSSGKEIGRKEIKIDRHTTADINGDKVVDISDISTLASYWGQKEPEEQMVDLNNDRIVDLMDLSIMSSYWNS